VTRNGYTEVVIGSRRAQEGAFGTSWPCRAADPSLMGHEPAGDRGWEANAAGSKAEGTPSKIPGDRVTAHAMAGDREKKKKAMEKRAVATGTYDTKPVEKKLPRLHRQDAPPGRGPVTHFHAINKQNGKFVRHSKCRFRKEGDQPSWNAAKFSRCFGTGRSAALPAPASRKGIREAQKDGHEGLPKKDGKAYGGKGFFLAEGRMGQKSIHGRFTGGKTRQVVRRPARCQTFEWFGRRVSAGVRPTCTTPPKKYLLGGESQRALASLLAVPRSDLQGPEELADWGFISAADRHCGTS